MKMKLLKKLIKSFTVWSKSDVIFASVLVAIFLSVGWFYWFQWRPSEIRKECSQVREEYLDRISEDGKIYQSDIKFAEFRYERCLNDKGLK